jgi:hypothetical protein
MNLFPLLIFPPRDPGGQANPDDTTGISETSPALPGRLGSIVAGESMQEFYALSNSPQAPRLLGANICGTQPCIGRTLSAPEAGRNLFLLCAGVQNIRGGWR